MRVIRFYSMKGSSLTYIIIIIIIIIIIFNFRQ